MTTEINQSHYYNLISLIARLNKTKLIKFNRISDSTYPSHTFMNRLRPARKIIPHA